MTTNLVKAVVTIMLLTNTVTTLNVPKPVIKQEYYNYKNPVLEIPKINLKKELYPNDANKNNVDKNIEVIAGSKMPTEAKTNIILASHSGSSSIAYFKHLDQITYNDTVYIYYQTTKYKYIIADIYDVPKTGYVEIKRDRDKNTATLITCKKNSNLQTVYIGYLTIKEKLHN
ncbi:MAG: sortase [Bacilli bacterium]|nr:sortase [Bacilli bacterium]